MTIHNFEEWEQSVLDRKLQAEKELMVSEIENRTYPKEPPSILWLHVLHGLKIVVGCLFLGGCALFVIRNFTEWFAPLIEFLEKVFPALMG